MASRDFPRNILPARRTWRSPCRRESASRLGTLLGLKRSVPPTLRHVQSAKSVQKPARLAPSPLFLPRPPLTLSSSTCAFFFFLLLLFLRKQPPFAPGKRRSWDPNDEASRRRLCNPTNSPYLYSMGRCSHCSHVRCTYVFH